MAALCLGPVFAQIKPPESSSKVKKVVLLYNKIGSWVAVNGIADVKSAVTHNTSCAASCENRHARWGEGDALEHSHDSLEKALAGLASIEQVVPVSQAEM